MIYIFLLITFLIGEEVDNRELDKAEQWLKHSVEYKAICSQTYKNATEKLEIALKENMWSAELSQIGKEDIWDKKPAIILDIDETVLDNIGFAEYLIELDTFYTPELWDKWVQKAEATAIVGAVEFIKKANKLGVEVFFITNRECFKRDTVDCPQEEETISNLKKIGIETDDYHILLKDEYIQWKSDKALRRQILTEQYRILLLIGDDFNDFYDNATNLKQADKLDAFYKNMNYFGEKWFMLPNPSYGSWQKFSK